MADSPPKDEVVEALEAGTTQISRRIKIFQSDSVTPWEPARIEDIERRLIDGSINVDQSRDERRTLDVTLDNNDGFLRPNDTRGFWYDKIIKVYRGLRYPVEHRPPRILIAEAQNSTDAYEIHNILVGLGFPRVTVDLSAAVPADLIGYDIVISYMKNLSTARTQLWRDAYNSGKSIITTGRASTETQIPLILQSLQGTWSYGISPVDYDTPVNGGWGTDAAGAAVTGRIPTALSGTSLAVASYTSGSTTYYPAIIQDNASGGKWFHYQLASFGTHAQGLLNKVLLWQWNYESYRDWEMQVGEFMIDNIGAANFPHSIKVTGRDYWKKFMLSKFESSGFFEKGTAVRRIILALAANSKIFQTAVPHFTDELENRVDFAMGQSRGEVVKLLCEAFDKEIYFDHKGVLRVRDFLDPTTSPIDWRFSTGENGNLVTYERSINDTRIFNVVDVVGTRKGDRIPYFGRAKNNEPSSPTRIQRLGWRMAEPFSAPFFKSDEHCERYARRRLKRSALESYEISFSSIHYPWLEAGSIINLNDPDRTEDDPTRFLMDSLTYPLGLGPMSATGKRITFVEDTDMVKRLAQEEDGGEAA